MSSPVQFILERVDLGHGIVVWLDGNSKITAGNGTYNEPAPNAFSLPAASTHGTPYCPGATPACMASCYVRGLAEARPDYIAAYERNAEALTEILDSGEDVRASTAFELAQWIRTRARGGFRWHVSGDVWNVDHARWICKVVVLSGVVRHWIYTRTLSAVPQLCKVGVYLAVNISADADNYDDAYSTAQRNPLARLAYLQRTPDDVPASLPARAVLFPDYPLRDDGRPGARGLPVIDRRICPSDYFGHGEQYRCGPCRKCM